MSSQVGNLVVQQGQDPVQRTEVDPEERGLDREPGGLTAIRRCWFIAAMRVLLLGLLLMAGCAAPKQPNSSESLAEEKRRAHAQRVKDNEKQNEELRKAVAQVYVRNHPALSSGIQKAIMHGRIKTGMTPWDVIASYALWEYTTDPGWAAYRAAGTVPLWALAGRRQIRSGTVPQEEWVLQREREMQYLYFEHGKLAKWKD